MRTVDELASAVTACEHVGWATLVNALESDEIEALGASLADLVLLPMEPKVGYVVQAGASAACAIAGRPILEALAELMRNAATAAGVPWVPDEAAVTDYGPGDGISPHRDNSFYEGFVAVVTLAGRAELAIVGDRAGAHQLARWDAGPGHLALFRGPRPGFEARPLHAVGPPGPNGRRVLVLRRNTRGAGRGWTDG